MRNSADEVGYSCSRTASTQCSDCGAELCESHTEMCDRCRSIFCPSCFCSSTKRNTRLSGPRSSGAKNCLNLFLVKIMGLSGAAKRYANNAKCGVIITRIGKPRISSAEKFPREWVPEPKNEMDWVLRSCLSIGESAVRRF